MNAWHNDIAMALCNLKEKIKKHCSKVLHEKSSFWVQGQMILFVKAVMWT